MLVPQIRDFRRKLTEEYVLGPFSKTSDPAFVEVLGYSGFDFVILDLEHGPNTIETMQDLIRAAQIGDILPIIRTKEDNLNTIGEALDIGCGGVQIPQVKTAAKAKESVIHAKFSPMGNRGVCRFVRAADYSARDRYQYFKEANETVVILQLEGKEALGEFDNIIAVEGIDVIFIGPYDLSQSLGIPGQISNPLVTDKIMEITEKCLKKNVAVGTFVDTLDDAKKWLDCGIKYLSYSVDVGLFYECCKNTIQAIKRA